MNIRNILSYLDSVMLPSTIACCMVWCHLVIEFLNQDLLINQIEALFFSCRNNAFISVNSTTPFFALFILCLFFVSLFSTRQCRCFIWDPELHVLGNCFFIIFNQIEVVVRWPGVAYKWTSLGFGIPARVVNLKSVMCGMIVELVKYYKVPCICAEFKFLLLYSFLCGSMEILPFRLIQLVVYLIGCMISLLQPFSFHLLSYISV